MPHRSTAFSKAAYLSLVATGTGNLRTFRRRGSLPAATADLKPVRDGRYRGCNDAHVRPSVLTRDLP